MAKRRERGDGGLRWSESRQRWIAEITIGYRPNGKRIVKSASHKNKTEAGKLLKKLIRDFDDGLPAEPKAYTVADAVNDWLKNGLLGRDEKTVETKRYLADSHVIPAIGARKLRELTADDVDAWLAEKAKVLSTRTLRDIRAILRRAIKRAQARAPRKPGRCRGLTLTSRGNRTPIRPCRHTSWCGGRFGPAVTPRHRSRADRWRYPARCVAELEAHKRRQARWRSERLKTGSAWTDHGLVFASERGTELDAANVRRRFRRVLKAAGLRNPNYWTPRELRHSFVSLLSDDGVPIEQISRLVGHSDTSVTELVYRHQIRPVVQDGASAIDRLFPGKASQYGGRRTAVSP